MAKEGMFFKKIGTIHSKHHTPANSLLLQGAWAAMLVLSGTFDQLTDMLIWVGWIFLCYGGLCRFYAPPQNA